MGMRKVQSVEGRPTAEQLDKPVDANGVTLRPGDRVRLTEYDCNAWSQDGLVIALGVDLFRGKVASRAHAPNTVLVRHIGLHSGISVGEPEWSAAFLWARLA